jgi:hypothetical protein
MRWPASKITLGSRIIAVCDSSDAVISHRPYAPRKTIDDGSPNSAAAPEHNSTPKSCPCSNRSSPTGPNCPSPKLRPDRRNAKAIESARRAGGERVRRASEHRPLIGRGRRRRGPPGSRLLVRCPGTPSARRRRIQAGVGRPPQLVGLRPRMREIGFVRRLWFAPHKLLNAPLARFDDVAQVPRDDVAFAWRQLLRRGVDLVDHRC